MVRVLRFLTALCVLAVAPITILLHGVVEHRAVRASVLVGVLIASAAGYLEKMKTQAVIKQTTPTEVFSLIALAGGGALMYLVFICPPTFPWMTACLIGSAGVASVATIASEIVAWRQLKTRG